MSRTETTPSNRRPSGGPEPVDDFLAAAGRQLGLEFLLQPPRVAEVLGDLAAEVLRIDLDEPGDPPVVLDHQRPHRPALRSSFKAWDRPSPL
ncbi:MAG: hypothetical protein R6V58_17485 [Planctomycetota bacterium]